MEAAHFEAPAPGGSRPPNPGDPGWRPKPEPIVNAPWPVAALSLGILAAFAVQSRFPLDLAAAYLAFSPQDLLHGRYWGLVTSLFAHGNWAHALMNAAFILAFGAPVARYFGPKLWGVIGFFAFYFSCGVLACLGFAALHLLVHPDQPAQLLGASGAASGLMGGTARLLGGGGQQPGRVFSPQVVSMGGGWVIVNAIMAVAGGSLIPGAGGAAIGWEAHLAGFAVGVLLIAPFGWAARRG
ncbi:MAG TPA: rhomboid family intramembrane serine protease [Phenylobacterium sp.]|nr:rhomboid family intramembrane serine protease [Phenylobacterium sp.]